MNIFKLVDGSIFVNRNNSFLAKDLFVLIIVPEKEKTNYSFYPLTENPYFLSEDVEVTIPNVTWSASLENSKLGEVFLQYLKGQGN